MELFLAIYVLIGLIHGYRKANHPDIWERPSWAVDNSNPFKILGILFLAAIWPLSMLAR